MIVWAPQKTHDARNGVGIQDGRRKPLDETSPERLWSTM
jgi:hypothetical protein